MALLSGKKALILGVANDKSIAWAIAKEMKNQGAQVALTYLNDALKKRVEPLAQEIGADFICEMDVTVDDHYPRLNQEVRNQWGTFDILVHSLAYAERDDLKGRFVETSRPGYSLACDVSAYSLVGLCQALKGLMNPDGSVLAMTYHGSVKVLQGYNVMGVAKAALESSMRYLADDLGPEGIRVNCISAGPIRTLAASGVPGLKDFLKTAAEKAPLRRNITQEDVAGAAIFLAGPLGSGVTGQVIYVDGGLSIIGA